jgi:twitching motility protein PilT
MVTPAVSNLIREGKTFQILSIMQTGRKLGMITLTDALADLVRRKLVEPVEAWRKAIDKPSLVAALRKLGVSVEGIEDSAAVGATAARV